MEEKEKRGGVSVKAFLYLLLLAVVTVLVIWWLGERKVGQVEKIAEARLKETTSRLVEARAASLADAIATLSRGYLENQRQVALQESYDRLVRTPGISSITMIDLGGVAVVATDRNDLDLVQDSELAVRAIGAQQPVTGPDEMYVPIMAATSRLGTLRLVYDPTGEELLRAGTE